MSLTALPVTASEIQNLQLGINGFTTPADATTQAGLINGGSNTVFGYAQQLLSANMPLAQVAMAVRSIMISTPSVATFQSDVNFFLPPQIAVAVAYGYDPTVYASSALGLALAPVGAFQTSFGVPSTFNLASKAVFVGLVSNRTGVTSTSFISGQLDFYINFYTTNPQPGLTASQAAAGATVGICVGEALKAATAQNLQVTFTGGHINGVVGNALVLNALGTYTAGTTLSALSAHSLLQGEV